MSKSSAKAVSARKPMSPTGSRELSLGRAAGRVRQSPKSKEQAEDINQVELRNREAVGKGRQQMVVRDSFTMPIVDYALIGTLKKRCLGMGVAIKKSELLRAGLGALHRLSDDSLAQLLATVENVKTGRPSGKGKKQSERAKESK